MAGNLESFLKNFDKSSNMDDKMLLKEDKKEDIENVNNTKNVIKINFNKKDDLIIEKFQETNLITEEKIEEKPKENKTEIKASEVKKQEDLTNEKIIEQMFLNSGTISSMKDMWLETYKKGLKSIKTNLTVKKIKNGRFRITEEGKLEILPDLKVESMETQEIFKQKWIKEKK